MTGIELESRLIDFAVKVMQIKKELQRQHNEYNLSDQLYRSATSAALNYGEARGGESKRDFIHKIQITLKELRESHVCLRIIKKANLLKDNQILEESLLEANQLISIFVKSVNTLKSK